MNQDNDQYDWHTNAPDGGMEVVHLDPASAAQLPDDQLRTNAFFDMTYDTDLFGPNGSVYAQVNRNRILSDAIPALTLPIGANPVPGSGIVALNLDMQANYENGWPADRMATEELNNWHHGDYRQVAYTFTYKLFNDLVNFGNLR